MNTSTHIWAIFGTRPEFIKLAPLIKWLREHSDLKVKFVHTGQHETLGMDTGLSFGLDVDLHLPIRNENRSSLNALYASIQQALTDHWSHLGIPKAVIVQGDTLSAFSAAETTYLHHIPVLHVEAGLRTKRVDEPWPEELFRILISRFASWHFAPTLTAKHHLREEGISESRILVTGNTVVDAFEHIRTTQPELFKADFNQSSTSVFETSDHSDSDLDQKSKRKNVLLTLHRRENQKSDQLSVASTLISYLSDHPEVQVTIIRHPNPLSHFLINSLSGIPGVRIQEAMTYPDFLTLMSQMDVILTDSGGLQEEAPLLGIPVIILRNVTERPEILTSGLGTLTGTDPVLIRTSLDYFLSGGKPEPVQLFGDGKACERIGAFLRTL